MEKDCYVSIPNLGEKWHQDQPPATVPKGSWLSDFCAFTPIVPSSLKSLISCHISSSLKQYHFSNCLLRPISNITSNVELSLILSGKICDLCHRFGVKQPQRSFRLNHHWLCDFGQVTLVTSGSAISFTK